MLTFSHGIKLKTDIIKHCLTLYTIYLQNTLLLSITEGKSSLGFRLGLNFYTINRNS